MSNVSSSLADLVQALNDDMRQLKQSGVSG